MARFFVELLPAEGTEYELTGENAAHAKVLRLLAGERVTLCDGEGSECECTVLDGLRLLAGPSLPSASEPRVEAAVYLAFPKADKAEHVIQKATELGAAEIVLFPSRYCVSRPDGKSLPKKLERWQKIARSAAEQSGRGLIPAVRALNSFDEALREAGGAEVPILFYEHERARTLKAELEGLFGSGPRPRIALMTGSEGGFSPDEIEKAEAAGMRICTLGARILRCETAPLAALTAVMFAAGEM